MSSRSKFMPRIRGAATLLAVLLAAPLARGEFIVGEKVLPIALSASGGSRIEIALEDDRLAFVHGEARIEPTALVVHLLQPDCLQCRAQLRALKRLRSDVAGADVALLGVSHRGDMDDLRKLSDELQIEFPMAMGVGSALANRFAAGDSMGIVDARGVIRFAQVGYADGDERLWQEAIEAIRSGGEVAKTGVDRDRLAVGDLMPAIRLPSLRSGNPMALIGDSGRLAFQDESGKTQHPKAAVGFFSRY